MIIWFSGSGNSFAVARKLAEKTQDTLLHLNDAPAADLSGEKVIGLVYPTYSYDAPLKVKEMLGASVSTISYLSPFVLDGNLTFLYLCNLNTFAL